MIKKLIRMFVATLMGSILVFFGMRILVWMLGWPIAIAVLSVTIGVSFLAYEADKN
jgi:hypothetical protein